jgi:integrase
MSKELWGEGSLFQQADGRWVATYSDNGTRKRVKGRTPKEANDKRKAALKRIAEGLTGTEPRATFSSVVKRWTDVTSLTLPLTTDSRQNYLDVLRLHVEPVVGKVKIGQMKPSHVEEVMVTMQAKGLSPSYRNQAHKAMSHIFKLAIRDGLRTTNPTREVPAPRGAVKVIVTPDRDVVVEMIDLAPDERLRTFIVLAAHTGLRIAEVLSLRWADVNYETRTIGVLGKGGKRRAVYVTPTLESQLRLWKVEQAKERLAAPWWSTEGDWIITTDIGTQMDTHNWRSKQFKPFADAIAPGATPHSLRHAFATLMLEEGVPMRVVADQMGHSSTRITEGTYSHVTARLQAEAGAAIERALGR